MAIQKIAYNATPNTGRESFNALIDLITSTGYIVTASGAPSDVDGDDGTYHLDKDTGDLYQKSAGTWGAPVANLLGPADMKKSDYDADDDGVVDQAEELFDGASTVTAAQARTHIDDTANPHSVTHPQTNPAAVDPLSTNTARTKHVSDNDAKGWEDHRARTDDPHAVTKAQVGLGNVTNDQQVPKAGGAFDGSVDWATGEPTVGLNPVVDSGSNTNGSWVRYYDGTQICWKGVLGVSYSTGDRLIGTWNYPVAFSSVPAYSAVNARDALDDVSASYTALREVHTQGVVATGLQAQIIGESASFSSGDTQNVDVYAIGRWY